MTGMRTGLVEAMFDLVADQGLDRLSVREVAARAGVSIGAVQHHFPTKDAMLAAAFDELVARTRRRIAGLEPGTDARANLHAVLAQLLPLDAQRAADARVHLAFSARAAVTPELALIQHRTLAGILAELTEALHGADAADTARILLAAVDGMALHAVSAPGLADPGSLEGSLTRLVDALVQTRGLPLR